MKREDIRSIVDDVSQNIPAILADAIKNATANIEQSKAPESVAPANKAPNASEYFGSNITREQQEYFAPSLDAEVEAYFNNLTEEQERYFVSRDGFEDAPITQPERKYGEMKYTDKETLFKRVIQLATGK